MKNNSTCKTCDAAKKQRIRDDKLHDSRKRMSIEEHTTNSSSSSASSRFSALTAAASLAQTAADFELAMEIATPMQTRTTAVQPSEIVKEQASQFLEIIDDETAKMNERIRVKAHALQSKKRKADDFQRQMSRLEE